MNIHQHYMRFAMNLALRHRGKTSDNPSVGCVLVKDNVIIGTGTTALSGRPHAEIEALTMAGDSAKGATAYVTLEPCAHIGKTGSCAEAFIKIGIKECYVSIIDPDPRTAGKGIEKLENAGIKTYVGLLEDEARECHSDFLTAQIQKRPFITLKSATSLDGKISYGKNLPEKKITSPAAHRQAHLLRSTHNAIAVGVNTILEDNPNLNCRLSGLENFSPDIIIFDRTLRTPKEANIFKNKTVKKIFIHNPDVSRDYLKDETVFSISADQPLEKILQDICTFKVNSLLIEGGAHLVTSFLKEDLWDQYAYFHANMLIGAEGLSAIQPLAHKIQLKEQAVKNNDMVLYKKA